MTSFIHLEYSSRHLGVERVESAIAAALQFALRLKASLATWSRKHDERLWAIAKTDSRVMAELQCAMTRDERNA